MNYQDVKIKKKNFSDPDDNMIKLLEKMMTTPPDDRTRTERLGMFFIRRLLLCFNPIAPFNWVLVGILAIVYHAKYKKEREKGELTSAQMWSKLIGWYLLVTIPIFTLICSILTSIKLPIIGALIVGPTCGKPLRPDEFVLTIAMFGMAFSMVYYS